MDLAKLRFKPDSHTASLAAEANLAIPVAERCVIVSCDRLTHLDTAKLPEN
jgi:hypothetical protein